MAATPLPFPPAPSTRETPATARQRGAARLRAVRDRRRGRCSRTGSVFAPLVGLAAIVGVIIAYVKRGDAQGTWVASHFTWLIRTFWWSLLWDLIGVLMLVTLGLILIGIPIAVALSGADVDLGDLSAGQRLPAVQGQARPVPGM